MFFFFFSPCFCVHSRRVTAKKCFSSHAWLLKEFERKRSTDRRNKTTVILCPKALWFSKTRCRKAAQKPAQFRSFVPVSWAISGKQSNELHEHKNMIFKTFEWWCKRIIKHMNKNVAHGVGVGLCIWKTSGWSNYTRSPPNMKKYFAENAPLQRTIKSYAGLESI